MKPEFSVILPVYNQMEHLQQIVDEYSHYLDAEMFTYEILLVVNGSKDDSYETALRLTQGNTRFRVFNLKEGGWGRAVKFGIEQCEGAFICYTNSARTHPRDLVQMLHYARVNSNNVVKANRIVRDSFLRKLGSVLYNFENRFFFRFPIWDVNGTPKVFPAHILKSMEIISTGDLIDAEIMARCAREDIPVIEIPVRVFNRISGKSTTGLKSALKMYYGLFRLRRKL
jgi:glycosyltransferase involved in cell wall biosynthesis